MDAPAASMFGLVTLRTLPYPHLACDYLKTGAFVKASLSRNYTIYLLKFGRKRKKGGVLCHRTQTQPWVSGEADSRFHCLPLPLNSDFLYFLHEGF